MRYVCCETQSDLREWFATFLSIQYDGDMWPEDGERQTRMSRALPDMHHVKTRLVFLEMYYSGVTFLRRKRPALQDPRKKPGDPFKRPDPELKTPP
uniref:PH domain-containing protein n=1 Tax=Knipowitschia caucasica TaxID=637954 RepID=A0AAV2J319_KNICA